MLSKRKASSSHAAPMSVTGGIRSSEQAGQVGGAPSASKRARVDGVLLGVEEEDLNGDLDLQEQERKRLQQGRKGRVVTAGYDSDEDSGNSEGEESASGRGNGKIAGVDQDDDMFAIEPEEDANIKEKSKGKKYLELGDIEGQEFSKGDSEDEDRDAELELETDEEEYELDEQEKETLHDIDDVIQPLKKKKKRPTPGDKDDMGFQIDSFNMKNEMASGRFDEDGNYIANTKDPHAEHDKWLTGNYSKKVIKAAKEAKEKQERERKAREKNQEYAKLDEDECMMKLAELMQRGETVLNALQRVGSKVKKSRVEKSKKEESNGTRVNVDAQNELDRLTSLSSALMSRFGKINIYDETYESLVKMIRKSGLVRETWDPAALRERQNNYSNKDIGHIEAEQLLQSSQFIYKWSSAYLAATEQEGSESNTQIFGPYSVTDLKSWFSGGFFGDSGERILLQEVPNGEDKGNGWKRWEQLF